MRSGRANLNLESSLSKRSDFEGWKDFFVLEFWFWRKGNFLVILEFVYWKVNGKNSKEWFNSSDYTNLKYSHTLEIIMINVTSDFKKKQEDKSMPYLLVAGQTIWAEWAHLWNNLRLGPMHNQAQVSSITEPNTEPSSKRPPKTKFEISE